MTPNQAAMDTRSHQAIDYSSLPYVAFVVVIAALLRLVLGLDTDVSWYIGAAERLLEGHKLYIDIFDTNTPAGVYLYVVPVAIGKVVGLSSETATDIFAFVVAGIVLLTCRWTLAGSALLREINGSVLFVCAAAIVLILPMINFSQREQFAAMAMMPIFAVYARRSVGERVSIAVAATAALGAAFGIAVKPPLGAAAGLAALAAAWQSRRLVTIFAPENLCAALLLVLNLGAIHFVFPEYFDVIVPAVREAYIPHRVDWELLVVPLSFSIWPLLLIVAVFVRYPPWSAAVNVMGAAALGGAIAYFLQGKGWSYQAYPMAAFGALAFAMLVLERVKMFEKGAPLGIRWIIITACSISLLMGQAVWTAFSARVVSIAREVRLLHPNPSMLLIGNNIALGHPLVRLVNGRWVGRLACLWATPGALKLLDQPNLDGEKAQRLRGYVRREIDILTQDIRNRRPDLIVVGTEARDWNEWVLADPGLAQEFVNYRRVLVFEKGILFQRYAGTVPRSGE